MTPLQFVQLFETWPIPQAPRLREALINGPHERPHGPRSHSPEHVGRTILLLRNLSYPAYPDWIRCYFQSGVERLKLLSSGTSCFPADYGRTPEELIAGARNLYEFLQREPDLCRSKYTDDLATEWFGHLVLVRSWVGAIGESTVARELGGSAAGWRPGTATEDLALHLDLIHDKGRLAVQVKRAGWSKNAAAVSRWLARSRPFDGQRYVVEYDLARTVATVSRVLAVRRGHLSEVSGLPTPV